jgi:hypothetical protein
MRKPNLVAVALASIPTAVVGKANLLGVAAAAAAIGLRDRPISQYATPRDCVMTDLFLRSAREQLYLSQNYPEGEP